MNKLKVFLVLMILVLTSAITVSQVLKAGEYAPDFTATADDGSTVKLSDYAGKNVVLYFYPKDMTPGCTMQAIRFKDNLQKFSDLNTVVLGVSVDDISSHQEFKNKESLNYTLISDADRNVSRLYGVYNPDKNQSNRVTYIINDKGQIIKVYELVDVNTNYREILDYLSSVGPSNDIKDNNKIYNKQ